MCELGCKINEGGAEGGPASNCVDGCRPRRFPNTLVLRRGVTSRMEALSGNSSFALPFGMTCPEMAPSWSCKSQTFAGSSAYRLQSMLVESHVKAWQAVPAAPERAEHSLQQAL